MCNPRWMEWAERLQAIAQNGLAYSTNPFDIERYHQLREVALEIYAGHTSESMPRLEMLFAGETGYATPKVDIRGVVFRDERILLVKELADGNWTLPGGWADVGEAPSLAVEREVLEETGYQVKARRLMALFDRNRHGHPHFPFHTYKIFFECDLIGGQPVDSIETAGADFFPENDLPPLSTMRTTTEVLARLFELHRAPDSPAAFD